MTTVLLVEDDADLRAMLHLALADEGYRVIEAGDAETGLYAYGQHAVDVVLVDVWLPGLDGLELCREIRRRGRTPLIIVTAQTDTADLVAGLEAGADDYVTKPLDVAELTARIRSVLRRARGELAAPRTVNAGRLVIELPAGSVTVDGEAVSLTAPEARVLATLAEQPNVVVTTEELLERVWGADRVEHAETIGIQVRRLQEKLERDPREPERIVAAGQRGYRLVL